MPPSAATSCTCAPWSARPTGSASPGPRPAARPTRRRHGERRSGRRSRYRGRPPSWRHARRMSDPVVITRPAAQATALARRVAAAGHEAVVFPLLAIDPLPDQSALRAALADVSPYALVAFVSPNAIDAACAIRKAWPREVTLAVVGEGSRAAL